MRVVRVALVMFGVAAGSWGVWLLSDDGFARISSTAIWLAGGILLHDFVLAPIVVGIGVVATRALPSRQRPVAAVAFLVWGTLTIAVANVLLDVGGKPDNDSLLNRPYLSAWLVVTGLVLGGVIATAAIRSRPRPADDA